MVHWFVEKEKGMDAFDWRTKEISKKGIFFGILYQIPFLIVSIYFLLK
jgi:hypothetical protein